MQTHAQNYRFEGIFITHAHMGHYTGLIHLGREAMNTNKMPVYGTQTMLDFLNNNAPWNQLIEIENIELRQVQDNVPAAISPNINITPLAVPHRNEYSDTLAYLVKGPRKKLFYCPDIDNWDKLPFNIKEFIKEVDIALIDGTFFAKGELRGRLMRDVPHPLIQDSVQKLQGLQSEVLFVHLNHTNPLWELGPERNWLEERGFGIGEQGQSWAL
jgi:pyrroloquinoline quinone biosynthesis protein B